MWGAYIQRSTTDRMTAEVAKAVPRRGRANGAAQLFQSALAFKPIDSLWNDQRHAALHHLLEIAIADGIAAVPTHAQRRVSSSN